MGTKVMVNLLGPKCTAHAVKELNLENHHTWICSMLSCNVQVVVDQEEAVEEFQDSDLYFEEYLEDMLPYFELPKGVHMVRMQTPGNDNIIGIVNFGDLDQKE